MVWSLRRRILLFLTLFLGLAFSSQAAVLRKDVISYSLDYYEIQQQKLSESNTLKQQQQESLEEKRQAALSRWKDRKEKINSFLNNSIITLEAKTSYNDNIFLQEANRKADIINTLSLNANYIPKVDWKRKKKTEFFFDFRGDGLSYSTGKYKEDTSMGLRTGFNYFITDKYGALLDYQFVKTQTTASGGLEDNDFVQRITNTFGGKLSADWGRFPCSLRYIHETSNFEEEFETSDTERDIMTATGEVRISPKTQVFAEYQHGEVTYPHSETSDYSFNTYSVGLRGKLSSKISGVTKVGWGKYDFDSGYSSETENVSGELAYHLSNRFLFNAGASRSIEPSTYTTDDASEQRSIYLQCRYFPPFNKKLSLRAGVTFTNIMMEESEREDDKMQLKLGTDYGLNRRTKLSLMYSRNSRDSNETGRDFTQNIITLKGAFQF